MPALSLRTKISLLVSLLVARQDLPFAVNGPASYQGYQFSLQEYGYAPRLRLAWGDGRQFDQFLKVSTDQEKDSFELGNGVRALVMFFPDFFREADRVGTRSRLPRNPVAMVKLYREGKLLYKGLFRPGEEAAWGEGRIGVPEYRQWATLAVVRENGMIFVVTGFLLVVAGLFVRFISNERRIEFELSPEGDGTLFKVSGYSRYYPAFLEKEVMAMAAMLVSEEVER